MVEVPHKDAPSDEQNEEAKKTDGGTLMPPWSALLIRLVFSTWKYKNFYDPWRQPEALRRFLIPVENRFRNWAPRNCFCFFFVTVPAVIYTFRRTFVECADSVKKIIKIHFESRKLKLLRDN